MTDALVEEILGSYGEKSLSELQSSIAKIESEIHANVTKHHNDLLAQTSNVEVMDDVVVNTLSRTTTCLANIRNTGDSLNNLYSKLQLAVTKQENLYAARQKVEVFEKVLRYNVLIEGERNLADVATYVEAIETLCSTSKLEKLKPYKDQASSLSDNIEKQTENMMIQGLTAASFNQVSSALQIFVNLNKLDVKITKVLNETEKQIERDIKICLTLKIGHEKPLTGGSSQPGRATLSSKFSQGIKKQVWSNVESLVTKLVAHTAKIKFLAHVMKTGKDLNSNSTFNDFVDENVWTKFWNGFMEALLQHLGTIKEEGMRVLFEDGFPKLLSIMTGMGNQIEDCSGLNTSVTFNSSLRGVTLNYEKAFLSKSLSKLFDEVNHMFAKTPAACPSNSDIDVLVGLINKEMNVEDSMLKKLVARNISKTIQLVCVRAEQLICNDGNATQVIGPATESQVSNSRLVNILDYLKSKLKPENCEQVAILMGNIMSPLVESISETIEAILLTMHQENFKRTSKTTEYSLYMGELSSFLQHVAKDYLNLYSSNETIQKSSHQLANRTIKSVVTNITLLVNLDGETRKQLAVDLNHVEVALLPICPVLHDGLRFLRTFRNMLQMNMEELQSSNLIGPLVPHSCALHLIINQTHGEIKLPNIVNNWSIPRYLLWLEEHSEKEKLSLLKTCVESYAQTVTAKGQTKFHPFYPLILDLITNSIE